MLNALIHTVIDEGLVDEEFITTRASNFEALRDNVKATSLDDGTTSAVVPLRCVKWRGSLPRPRAMILWGMGISMSLDNASTSLPWSP
jgi:formate dehydrogenase major subunit